jgi:hypothetical protein
VEDNPGQNQSKATEGRPPIPLDLLIPEMRRLASFGKLPDTKSQAAKILEKWLLDEHPDRRAKKGGIRGNKEFLDEHSRLTGVKS